MINNKLLFILIEGDDDERFFQNIIIPQLECKFGRIQLWKYAKQTLKSIKQFIKSIEKLKNADFIFIKDLNDEPFIRTKKQKIMEKYEINHKEKIIIVVKEIESWYLAGLDNPKLSEWKINDYGITNNLTKEKFKQLIPKNFDSDIDFKQEILKNFKIDKAIERNRSFKYFFDKYLVK